MFTADRTKGVSRTTFRSYRVETGQDAGNFEEAQRSYETQIASLKEDVERAKVCLSLVGNFYGR